MYNYKIVPEIEPGGHALNPVGGEFYIVKPIQSTNYANNPDMDDLPDTVGSTTPGDDGYYWSNIDNSSGRTTTEQMFGNFSFMVIPSDPVTPVVSSVYQYFLTTSGEYASFSLYIKGIFGVTYTIKITTPSKTYKKDYIGTDDWMRMEIIGYTNSGAAYFYLETTSGTPTFYTDGWQIEYFSSSIADKTATTFFTGTRLSTDYTGGRLVNLQDLGLIITGHEGLSSSAVSNVLTPYGIVDGSVYQSSKFQERVFTINGKILTNTRLKLNDIHKDLINLISPSRTGSSERTQIRLVYRQKDDRGIQIKRDRYIDCLYQSGLEGIASNTGENVSLRFVAPYPYFSEFKDNAIEIPFAAKIDDYTGYIQDDRDFWFGEYDPSVMSPFSFIQNHGNFFIRGFRNTPYGATLAQSYISGGTYSGDTLWNTFVYDEGIGSSTFSSSFGWIAGELVDDGINQDYSTYIISGTLYLFIYNGDNTSYFVIQCLLYDKPRDITYITGYAAGDRSQLFFADDGSEVTSDVFMVYGTDLLWGTKIPLVPWTSGASSLDVDKDGIPYIATTLGVWYWDSGENDWFIAGLYGQEITDVFWMKDDTLVAIRKIPGDYTVTDVYLWDRISWTQLSVEGADNGRSIFVDKENSTIYACYPDWDTRPNSIKKLVGETWIPMLIEVDEGKFEMCVTDKEIIINSNKITRSVPQEINNEGNAPTYPVFEINSGENIYLTGIRNVTSDKTVYFDETPILGVFTMDTENRTVYINDINKLEMIAIGDPSIITLEKGSNIINVFAKGVGNGPDFNGYITMRWKNRWLGID